MIALFFILFGMWAASWGGYSIFVAKHRPRRIAAAFMAPAGVLAFFWGLLRLVLPGAGF